MHLCFATNNKHKLQEVRHAVGSKISIVSLEDIHCHEELPETRDTLEGNSLQKAEYVYSNFQIPSFADDSGLEVEALNFEPGAFSARYAGTHRNDVDNMSLVLKKLEGATNRNARFRTVISLVGLGEIKCFEGIVSGKILLSPRGSAGFGYDPIFQPEGHSRSFAEMTMTEKNSMSHRALAVQKLLAFLKGYN